MDGQKQAVDAQRLRFLHQIPKQQFAIALSSVRGPDGIARVPAFQAQFIRQAVAQLAKANRLRVRV